MILYELFKESSEYKPMEKYFLDLLIDTNINLPRETNRETVTEWHNTNKEILVNSIIKPIFEFTLKYMNLLRKYDSYIYTSRTKPYWESNYILKTNKEEITLNYYHIKGELDKKILPTIFKLLSLTSIDLSEKIKSTYDELEQDYKEVENIFNKHILNFEYISNKEQLIKSLFINTLDFYILKPAVELSLRFKYFKWENFDKNKIENISNQDLINYKQPKLKNKKSFIV